MAKKKVKLEAITKEDIREASPFVLASNLVIGIPIIVESIQECLNRGYIKGDAMEVVLDILKDCWSNYANLKDEKGNLIFKDYVEVER